MEYPWQCKRFTQEGKACVEGHMVSPSPVEHYREKAVELRKLASELSFPGARKEFEAIAARYERLANLIEDIEEKPRQFGAR